MNVYTPTYRPIMTFGSESCVLTMCQNSKIQEVETKYQGKTKKHKVRNIMLRDDIEIGSILEFISRRHSW